MRAGWTVENELATRRPDSAQRLIPEACITSLSAVKQRKDQWDDADDESDFELMDDGGARLDVTAATVLEESSASDGNRTELDLRFGLFDAAKVTWAGDEPAHMEIIDIRANLNPCVDGVAVNKEVAWWACYLYIRDDTDDVAGTRLMQMGDPVRVVASGTSAADVTFDFSTRVFRPRPKGEGAMGVTGGKPVMYIEIRPLKGDGTTKAANVGWSRDSTSASVTTDDNVLEGSRLTLDDPDPGWNETLTSQTPLCRIRTGSYTESVLEYITNPMDLGDTPTETVEFVAQGELPSGTSFTFEVRNNADSAWIVFTDGQTSDDIGVSKRQTYKMRATFTPDASGSVTPVLRMFGVREVTLKDFDGLASVEGSQGQVDPLTLRSEVGEITIRCLRDGVEDYQDAISDILATYDLADIEWRIWWGPDPDTYPRADYPELWTLIDTYVIDDYATIGGAVELVCISVLGLLKLPVPIFDPDTDEREPLIYDQQTVKAVYEDIRDGQLGLAGRYGGPSIEDTTTRISNTITDSDAKIEMDAVAAVVGYANVASQGQIKAADMFGEKSVRAIFQAEDITVGAVSPGLRYRVPEFFVPYDYDYAQGRFIREVRGFHADAITKLGRGRIDAVKFLDEQVCRWLAGVPVDSITRSSSTATVTTSEAHGLSTGELVSIYGAEQDDYNIDATVTVTGADTFTYTVANSPTTPATGAIFCAILPHRIANRTVKSFGAGMMLVPFTTQYPHPELEVGVDMVAIETDRFVGRDIYNSDRVIRGKQWLIGVIQAINDLAGTDFVLWVRSPATIVSGTEASIRLGFALPEVLSLQLYGDEGGDGVILGEVNCKATRAVRWAESNTDYPDLATTQAGTLVEVSADGNAHLGTLDTLTNGQTGYVSILAYENVDGTGAESVLLVQKKITRRAAEEKTRWLAHNEFNGENEDEGTFLGVIAHAENFLYPNTASGTQFLGNASCSLVFPVGTTITEIAMEEWVEGAEAGPTFSFVGIEFKRIAADATVTTLATASFSDNIGDWGIQTDTLSETVDEGDSYLIYLTLRAVATAGTPDAQHARVSRVGITYSSPSYFETN